jgi:hypothetical protein
MKPEVKVLVESLKVELLGSDHEIVERYNLKKKAAAEKAAGLAASGGAAVAEKKKSGRKKAEGDIEF